MKVKVMRLHEDFGRPLGKWREAFLSGIAAELHLGQRYHKVWKRTVKTASLIALVPNEAVFLPLDDAEVLVIEGKVLRITGTETDEVTRKEYKQTWHCELV